MALILLSSSPAQAALLDETPTQYCWTNIDSAEVRCVDGGYDEMVDDITDVTGTPVIAEPTSDETVTPASRGVLATYLLAIVYDSTNLGGSAMSYVTMNSAICSATYAYASLGSWNDRIESFEAYNGCSVVLYQDANYGGAHYGFYTLSTDVGTMKNQASSMAID